MGRFTLVLAALAVGFPAAFAQENKEAAGDKIGKDKAPTVAKKALNEFGKRKGAAITLKGELSSGAGNNTQKVTGDYAGVLRKDFAGVKGTLEIYAQGTKTLVNTGARFDPPEEIQGQQAQQTSTFKNPAVLVTEVSKLVNTASFLADETVDGKECRELTFVADPATVKQYLKEIADRLNSQMRGFGGGFGGFINWSNALDEKGTIATYSVLVGKNDLNLYKLVFVIKPKINPKAIPQQLQAQYADASLDQRYEVKFSKWDEEVAFEIPAAIKAKWGIK